MGYDATLVFEEDWVTKLQERLSEPTIWKEICKVEYTDTKVLHNPYMTDAVVSTLSRGTAYTMHPIVETDENITIDSAAYMAQFIDRADLAQTSYVNQMEMASSQGVLLNEYIGTAVFADHANLTDFGSENLTGTSGSTQITVSATNVDDIISSVWRTIRSANGESLANRNGVFIVWRPKDLQALQTFAMANGFTTADQALKNGVTQGWDYMNVTHYSSNLLAANHLIAGVKKVYHLGICKSTYGQIVITQDPGLVSGIGIVSRVDYKGKAWTKTKPVLFDVNVAS